jgi:hypothetical protein
MPRQLRPEDYETPTVAAAEGFEEYHAIREPDDDRRDALRDAHEDTAEGQRAYWKAVREGRTP